MPRQCIKPSEAFPASLAFEGALPFVQEHVALAVVLACKAYYCLWAAFVLALVWSFIVVRAEVTFEVEVACKGTVAARDWG